MKRRNEEEGEEGVGWKNSQGSAHLIVQTKCLISPPASPFCSSLPSLGQAAPSDLQPIFFSALKCIGCFSMKRAMQAEPSSAESAYGANQQSINQTAMRTPEKVQSKQTGLSHDSRGIVGPHRSQARRRDHSASQNIL